MAAPGPGGGITAVRHDAEEASAKPDGVDDKVKDGSLRSTDDASEPRVDPDAQTTVTDFLDFTEYLPSDMVRSLTLIGQLDQTYTEASRRVDDLTTTWGQLPAMSGDGRPSPVRLRADISEHLNRAVSSRVFAHAEAVRMSESVNRHYNKAKILLSKLQTMMDNYPTEDQKSPVAPKSPQLVRAKLTVRAGGEGGQGVRRTRVPRITVPGEVLAPYDIEYDTFTDDSDISSDDDYDTPATERRTPAPRIKLVTNKPHKVTTPRPARVNSSPSAAMTAAAAANAAALLNPPPSDAIVGSADAPWLQLTQYELAKLRKRMKKNATWTPSETMIARELKALNRGPDAYREAKKKAEDDGEIFDPTVPALVVDNDSGTQQLPAGAMSVDSVAVDDVPTSNRGMKLNEAKKLKREALAKMAAEEAEESARKMTGTAKLFSGANGTAPDATSKNEHARATSRSNGKRKRDDGDGGNAAVEEAETPTPKPQTKRSKTETPVPPPQHPVLGHSNMPNPDIITVPTILLTPGGTSIGHSETPVPIPMPPAKGSSSPASANTSTVTTSIPIKPPAAETPVPLPVTDRRRSSAFRDTPARERRETRGDSAKRTQQQQTPSSMGSGRQPTSEPPTRRSMSRGLTPGSDPQHGRRPGSRGKAMSQEPQSSLASDRPRRASTARNTPAPESRPASRRAKRPAPGVVSTTSGGGSSAVGKRKAATTKKPGARKREKDQAVEMEEVDDEGNPIDPDEPRYCLCNRVSFGTMIRCDNGDACKHEWFHIECVGLDAIPARTTKWYCPDCRKLLKLGEKGEVSARGVRI